MQPNQNHIFNTNTNFNPNNKNHPNHESDCLQSILWTAVTRVSSEEQSRSLVVIYKNFNFFKFIFYFTHPS